MLLQVSCILIFHFAWVTSALQCLDCSQPLDLKLSEIINTAGPGCHYGNAQSLSCSQSLHVQYLKESAFALFKTNPNESLILSNAPRLMTNRTMIWLNQFKLDQTFEISCFHANACNESAINDIYLQVREFKYSDLWANLEVRLYDAVDNPANLKCADNQDKPVSCPYGFCQLISSDSSSFSRSCVLNNSLPNPYGVLLESKAISEKEIQSSLMYTCNKPMCNNSTMAKEVRHMLEERKILLYSITTTTTTTTTSKPIATSTNGSTRNTVKPLIIIQYGLILLMTIIFQK